MVVSTMFGLLSSIVVLFVIVLSYVGGASIGQTVSSSSSNEQHNSHTIADLTKTVWKDLHSSMNKAWEKVKLFAGIMDTNKTIQESRDQDSYPPQVTQTTTNFPKLQVLSVDNKTAVNQNDSFLITNTVVATDETNNDDCEGLTCLTWRVLKIVGTAVGVGFIVSLFTPVLFYFTILNIGYLCYGITFLLMALLCKADKGRQLGEKFFTACQEVGGSSLQNMFSPFPVFLTWLGSGCLVGWFIWPYF